MHTHTHTHIHTHTHTHTHTSHTHAHTHTHTAHRRLISSPEILEKRPDLKKKQQAEVRGFRV
jgi:hypothetical protein